MQINKKGAKDVIIFTSFLDATGGMENWVYNFSHELNKRNYNLTVVSLFNRKDFPEVKEFPFRWHSDIKTYCMNLPSLAPRSAIDIFIKLISFKLLKNQEKNLLEIFHNMRNPIIILTDPGYSLIFPEYFFRRYKIIAQLHSSAKTFFVYWKLQYIYLKFVYKKFTKIIVLSKNDQQYLIHKGFNQQKIEFIYNFISTLPSKEAKSKPTSKKIIYLGRLSPQKNVGELIDIFAEVSKRYPEWSLEIYGDGEERKRLEKKVSDLGIKQIIFHGNTLDKYKALSSGSIMAMASLFEGFPMTILESRACQLAVITYNSALAMPEIIENGKDGIIINDYNRTEYIKKLTMLMSSKDERDKIAKNGYEKNKEFTCVKILDEWENKIFKPLS